MDERVGEALREVRRGGHELVRLLAIELAKESKLGVFVGGETSEWVPTGGGPTFAAYYHSNHSGLAPANLVMFLDEGEARKWMKLVVDEPGMRRRHVGMYRPAFSADRAKLEGPVPVVEWKMTVNGVPLIVDPDARGNLIISDSTH